MEEQVSMSDKRNLKTHTSTKRKRGGDQLNSSTPPTNTPNITTPINPNIITTANTTTNIPNITTPNTNNISNITITPNTNNNTNKNRRMISEEDLVEVKVDTKAFRCFFCSSPLRPYEITFCDGGHVSCLYCSYTKFKNKKCSECSSHITHSTCWPLINILNAITVNCCFSSLGCQFKASYFGMEKQTHENHCSFEPCRCPIDGCTFKSTNTPLSSHIFSNHCASLHTSFSYKERFKVSLSKDTPFHVLLEESKYEPVFLLLNGDNFQQAGPGRCLSIVCLRLENEGNRTIRYMMKLKIVGEDAKNAMEFYIKSVMVDVVQPEKKCPGEFLYVPNDVIPDGVMDLEIHIL